MPTMADLDRLLGEFVDAWNAGERPRVEAYLERAPARDQDDLAALIASFLDVAPSPAYSQETLSELMREPALAASVEALEGESGLWPSLLPRLRRRARLRREEVVAQLVDLLGLGGGAEKTARYLHELESGTLDSSGVSRRVIEALARVLGTSAEELAAAGDARGLAGGAPVAAFLRAEPEVVTDAADTAAPSSPDAHEEWDAVDRLFRGGR